MKQRRSRLRASPANIFVSALLLSVATLIFVAAHLARAQAAQIAWTSREKPIADRIHGLRQMPDDTRVRATKELALEIRQLPASPTKPQLANALAMLSTEGDFGHDTLQEVATTLADALRQRPISENHGQPSAPYIELAQLVHFEHVQTSLDDPQFSAAMAKIEADDARRQQADFTLTDLRGNSWTLKSLRGKVVLVNFWATWCPPCRKEMPDLERLYERFSSQGFVVLAISDENQEKVKPFIEERKITYPILLDVGRKVNDLFQIEGIPKSFVYDRAGKLVAESIDMRTEKQFLEMLGLAGLQE